MHIRIISINLQTKQNKSHISECDAKFLDKNFQINPAQHGIQKEKSITTALLNIIENIIKCFYRKEYTQITFCDLTKAFDMTDRNILDKLWLYVDELVTCLDHT